VFRQFRTIYWASSSFPPSISPMMELHRKFCWNYVGVMFTVTCNVLNSSNDDICVTDRVLSQCSLPGWQCWLAWRGVMMQCVVLGVWVGLRATCNKHSFKNLILYLMKLHLHNEVVICLIVCCFVLWDRKSVWRKDTV